MRYAVLQKLIGALHKAAFFVQPTGVDLGFELYLVRAEYALCRGDAFIHKPRCKAAVPLDGNDAPYRGGIKKRMRREQAKICLNAVVVAQKNMVRSEIRSVNILIRAILLDDEHRVAQTVYLPKLADAQLGEELYHELHGLYTELLDP